MYPGLHELTSADIIVTPRNTAVERGQSVVLNCRTNITGSTGGGLWWKFTSVDGEEQKFIHNDNGLNKAYEARNISVTSDPNVGDYPLVFSAIELQDAGTYTCQEDAEVHAAWIAVLGQHCLFHSLFYTCILLY